jgi:hypothetical protein
MERDLVTHVARFAGALRERGIRVGLSDEVDGVSALTLVDVSDRGEVLRALRAALKIRRRDRAAFDALFERLWSGKDAHLVEAERPKAAPLGPRHTAPLPSGRRNGEERGEERRGADASDVLGYSPEILLRRKAFDECSAAELAAMERLLARLALRLAVRRSRRLVPTRTRGVTDLRRSFRRAVGTGGELLSLARRERAVEEPRLVVLCDTSGSMDPHARFLLSFVLSLRRVARRAEVFAFNTSLTRLTPWLSPGRIGPALDRLAAAVPDWSGGTRIGESLAAFVEEYLDDAVDARTVVVILSDGLDRGDTALLEGAMRAIRARARKVIWLNPLMGDSRYEPAARGMRAALPFVDHFAPAHNVESLERLLPMLA